MTDNEYASKISKFIKKDIEICMDDIETVSTITNVPDSSVYNKIKHVEEGLDLMCNQRIFSLLSDDEANDISYFVVENKRRINELESYYLYGK